MQVLTLLLLGVSVMLLNWYLILESQGGVSASSSRPLTCMHSLGTLRKLGLGICMNQLRPQVFDADAYLSNLCCWVCLFLVSTGVFEAYFSLFFLFFGGRGSKGVALMWDESIEWWIDLAMNLQCRWVRCQMVNQYKLPSSECVFNCIGCRFVMGVMRKTK